MKYYMKALQGRMKNKETAKKKGPGEEPKFTITSYIKTILAMPKQISDKAYL